MARRGDPGRPGRREAADAAGSAQAAEFLKEARWTDRLRRRRAALLGRWPAPLAESLRRLESARRARAGRARRGPAGLPFWLVVPLALDEAQRSPSAARGDPFLGDVLWGQYCLFQCIRLQDDVFDGHTGEVALVYASDQFLIEAQRTFARLFPRSAPFREAFWRALESTTQAIVRVDAMQRRLGTSPSALAREYAKVASVLKVGTIAVCMRHRGRGRLAALDRFADDVASGDQILDDLDDVAEDLRRGRFNYVAQRLCPPGTRSDPAAARRALAEAIASGDGAERVLGDARRRFERASLVAAGIAVPGLAAIAAGARRAVDGLEGRFLRAQAERVLAPLRRAAR